MRNRSRIIGPLCSALALAVGACAVKQPPAPAATLAGVLPPTTTVPAAWTAPDTVSGAVATDWVKTLSDPQLDALVEEGLRNNLDLKAALARVELASAVIVQAKSLLYPQLGIAGGTGVVGRDDTRDRSGAVAEFSWELDLWGRVRAQAASARASQEASAADLLHARQSVAATIATLWYQNIALERLRQTAFDATTVYDELLRLVKMRNQVGQVGEEDVNLAGADLDRVRRQEREFATSAQELERGLEIVLGRYPSAEISLAPDLPALPPPVPSGLPSDLLARRADLVAAERRVASAFHAIQVAQAARLPRIALTGSGGVSTSELLRLADVPAGFWTVAANFLAPIFTGGALKAEVTIATADQQAAVALYGQTALRAFSEVESSLASEQLLADQERYLQSTLLQDSEAVRLGRIRYGIGATDLLHVLQLQARQLTTRFDLIGVRSDRLINRIALHLALGGGFDTVATP